MEMVADELSEERDKWWIAFGNAILESSCQVDFARGIGSLNCFGDEYPVGFGVIFIGRLETLGPGDGRFEGIIREI